MDAEKNEKEQTATTFEGGVTEEQITKWKAQHRKVIRIDVTDDEELHIGYFKRPTLEVMQAVSKIGKSDEFKASETLFNGCWLGGSELLKQDSVLYIKCMEYLNKAFAQTMGSLKNL